eukprot:g7875.t1
MGRSAAGSVALEELPTGMEAFVVGENKLKAEFLAALSLGGTPGPQLSTIALLKACGVGLFPSEHHHHHQQRRRRQNISMQGQQQSQQPPPGGWQTPEQRKLLPEVREEIVDLEVFSERLFDVGVVTWITNLA